MKEPIQEAIELANDFIEEVRVLVAVQRLLIEETRKDMVRDLAVVNIEDWRALRGEASRADNAEQCTDRVHPGFGGGATFRRMRCLPWKVAALRHM